MAEIKNTFLKQRMNQDIDSRILPNGEYREAINLMISRSEGSTVGEFENALGNSSIRSLNTSNSVIIGHYVNETTNKVYLFASDYDNANGVRSTSANNFIYELTLEGSFNLITLVTGNFLNFNKSFPVIGVNLVEELLFFTDNLNQPRKINISLANPTQLATPIHYVNEDQISVAKYAPCDPIVTMQRVKFAITGTAASDDTTISINDSAGIKIGDFISPYDTISPSTFPTPFSQWNKANYVVDVPADGVSLVLSKPMTAPNSFDLIAQRSTMTNKTSLFNSNGLAASATVAGNSTGGAAGSLTATYRFNVDATNFSPDVIPRIGDIVTGVNILDGTTILTTSASYGATTTAWTVTLSKITDIADGTGNAINVAVNQNYDASWQGDAAFLEDKFVRFSYRFKFEDNEYSLMAPFSQPMFIPKQYSEFGAGQNPDFVDMDNAYKSTILNWFENSVDNIVLRTPMPFNTPALMTSELLAIEVDLLYKESDALAVKVLDTVRFSDLQSSAFDEIIYSDPIHGEVVTQDFYDYNYASSKPYKTLPTSQTTRVYDKVPIKALAQELIGNRVVYGNYVDKHSSPDSIQFSALISDKRPYNDNFIQYPYHNLKQSRTYQVGFVLSDRYGRQSDVILSSYDNVDGVNGSTVFAPYNSITEQINNPIIDWLGTSLNVRVDSAIGQATTGGQPGIWNATTNPLGWYSYKVVVKQQEQEYYNVYLPGFVNGLPIVGTDEENKSSFSVLLSDNINKVPRNLNEVGPTDTEYSSSELLYIRVNNPNINAKSGRPYGYPLKTTPWNQQYYPGFFNQEVLSIATIKDMEISGIPFKPNAPEGDYGQVGSLFDNGTGETTPVSIGSIPWGVSPKLQPFYNSDLNPFAIKIDTTANGKVALVATAPIVPGGVGADTNAEDGTSATPGIITMQPFLSVAETKPVYSLLEIFWETSLQGKINTLNNLIDAQYAGITTMSSTAAAFLESDTTATQIGNSLTFATGGGTTVTDASLITVTLLSAFRQSDVNQTTDVKTNFDLALKTGQALAVYDLDTATTFFYSTTSQLALSTDVYDITVQTVYDDGSGNAGFPFTDTHSYVATLDNVAPSFTTNPMNPSGITIASTTIKQYAAVNGTATAANETDQLVFSLGSGNPSSVTSQFAMSSSGLLTTNSALTEGDTWSIIITVTDVDGNGISTNATITFTVGVQHVPQAICNNNQLSAVATCTQSYEVFFGVSSTTTSTGAYGTVGGVFYPGNSIQFYNVRANFSNATTGALTQGVMALTPLLTSIGGSGGGDLSVYYTVQYRANAQANWTQAVDTGGNSISSRQITASTGFPGTETLNFSIPGEYRAFSTNVTGGGCTGNTGGLKFNFTDATYSGSCNLGPL